MRTSCKSLIIVIAVLSFNWAQGAAAQTTNIVNDPNVPLQILSVQMSTNGRYGPTQLKMENTADTPIAAYVIVFRTHLSDGTTRRQDILVDHRALGLAELPPSAPKPHAVFETPTRGSAQFKELPLGVSATSFDVSVAYAELSDGKVSGPQSKKFQEQLCLERGIRRTERERLRKLSEQQGAAGLVKDLSRK